MLLVLYTASSGVVVRYMFELLPFWRKLILAQMVGKTLQAGGLYALCVRAWSFTVGVSQFRSSPGIDSGGWLSSGSGV